MRACEASLATDDSHVHEEGFLSETMLGTLGAVRTASLRIATPLQTALMPSSALARPGLESLPTFAFGGAIQTRNSAKRGGGTTKNNRNSAGRRLGVKRSGCTYSI